MKKLTLMTMAFMAAASCALADEGKITGDISCAKDACYTDCPTGEFVVGYRWNAMIAQEINAEKYFPRPVGGRLSENMAKRVAVEAKTVCEDLCDGMSLPDPMAPINEPGMPPTWIVGGIVSCS